MRQATDRRFDINDLWPGEGTGLAAEIGCARDGAGRGVIAALVAGHYDQSHFIREFRRFVGCAPSDFFNPGSELATALIDA